jgi:hypothetical protein
MKPKNKIKPTISSHHLASGTKEREREREREGEREREKAKLVNVSSSRSPNHVVKGKNSCKME